MAVVARQRIACLLSGWTTPHEQRRSKTVEICGGRVPCAEAAALPCMPPTPLYGAHSSGRRLAMFFISGSSRLREVRSINNGAVPKIA